MFTQADLAYFPNLANSGNSDSLMLNRTADALVRQEGRVTRYPGIMINKEIQRFALLEALTKCGLPLLLSFGLLVLTPFISPLWWVGVVLAVFTFYGINKICERYFLFSQFIGSATKCAVRVTLNESKAGQLLASVQVEGTNIAEKFLVAKDVSALSLKVFGANLPFEAFVTPDEHAPILVKHDHGVILLTRAEA